MKLKTITKASLSILFAVATLISNAAVISGTVVDKATKEPLIGATVIVAGTSTGSITGLSGEFQMDIPNGKTTLNVNYITYVAQTIEVNVTDALAPLNIEMQSDQMVISEVKVAGRKNLENELALTKERSISTTAIENIGAKEMSVKGLSTVEDGVKKMTGISVASAGQVIVRGLGDRYSITTLNGQPIASPNPDNKLIPLDVFPSSAVKNVTVSKVYDATSYADYSGARIDITTKDQRTYKFFSLDFSVGAYFTTIGRDFYSMDNVSMFSKSKAADPLLNGPTGNVGSYVAAHEDSFETDFSVNKSVGLPNFGGNIGYGNSFNVGNQKLSILATAGIDSYEHSTYDNTLKNIEATGSINDERTYDQYEKGLDISALANLGLTLRKSDNISYTAFYARNASRKYQNIFGYNEDLNTDFRTSNNVDHIYSMFTNQLHGKHALSDKWDLDWNGSYTTTSSDEPDRRQVMFRVLPSSGDLQLLLDTDDQQATMRYFSALEENEVNGDAFATYTFGENSSKLKFGGAYKNKDRNFSTTSFYYKGLYNIRNEVVNNSIYDTNSYLNWDNLSDGTLTVSPYKPSSNSYTASTEIISGFATLDYYFAEDLLVNFGLRYENATQTVNYSDDNGKPHTRTLPSSDLFPALNVKYNFNKENQIRVAASRTITRPSFIEMAPFKYQESYGSTLTRGNAYLDNAYNYNIDLRYESFLKGGDMYSITAYYKQLVTPIERVQTKEGSATVETFMNAEGGSAIGLEIEYRETIVKDLKVGVNASFMYTNVNLSDGGVYTNKDRQLQGASPYLVNADITYSPKIGDDKQLTLALLYNLQGPRIHAVGVNGRGDVYQKAFSMLNFNASYQVSKLVKLSLGVDNLLNSAEVYEQEMHKMSTDSDGNSVVGAKTGMVEVERHRDGLKASLGVSLNF